MCGITGCLSHESGCDGRSAIVAMSDALVHRGPDDSSLWHDEITGVTLAHRRLSVLDLSPLGRQPMESACGRYVIVYNGEVYNHRELRVELETLGHSFRGGSDTETMLAAIVEWGLRQAVKRFVGMFAFALWDKRDRKLALIRDRLGIKPLFYGSTGRSFLFASELKSLVVHPYFVQSINRDALALYFRHNYIPAPHSIYEVSASWNRGLF